MADSAAQIDLGDESKRHHMVPLVVGSINVPDKPGGSEHPPLAMVLTVDADTVPGFREVLARQQSGEEFDVTSRWASAIDHTGKRPPQLVLDFYLPEVKLGISIYIDVDEHPDSIRAMIRTGMVVIVDPEMSLRLQREPIGKTLDDLRVFTVQPPDSSPAIGVLQQRFDFPREAYVPERYELKADGGSEEVEKFFEGARSLAGIGVQVRGDALSVIALIDTDLEAIKKKIPDGAELEGAWGVLAGGEHSVIAFDIAIGGERLARWLIPDPHEDIVLAGSNGAHWVVLSSEPLGDDGYESWMSSAICVVVKQVEALRALRLDRAGRPDRDE